VTPPTRVLDGAGHPSLVTALVAAARALGLAADPGAEPDLRQDAGPLMLVLPAVLEARPLEPMPLLYRLDRLAARPRPGAPPAGGSARLVVVWAVRREDRFALTTPHDGQEYAHGGRRRAGWNAAALLTGGVWARERARHGGEVAAVRCLSGRVERLFASGSHQDLAGTDAASLLTALRRVDGAVLHTVCPQADPRTAGGGPDGWLNTDAAAAALAVRLSGPSRE
jgi:hypothetical protein